MGPDRPAEITVRFRVADPGALHISRMQVDAAFEGTGDPRLGTSVAESGANPASCVSGCEVVSHLRAAWVGDPKMPVWMRWTAELAVEYDTYPPNGSVSVISVDGNQPALLRTVWLVFGAVLAAGIVLGLRRARGRYGATSAALGIGLVLLAGAALAWFVPDLGEPGAAAIVDWSPVWALVGTIAVGWPAAGLLRGYQGDAGPLHVLGWMAVYVGGYLWWLNAEQMSTARTSWP